MKDSLHYTTEDVLNIKELIHRDDLESRGSYLYEGSAVASGYFADSKYYLLALKFDSLSSSVKYILEKNISNKDLAGTYSTIVGDKLNTYYNTREIRQSFPIKTISFKSDGKIIKGVENDTIMEFNTQMKSLVVYFNGNEKAQLYMETKYDIRNAEMLMYKKDMSLYIFFMTANGNFKRGTLRDFLFTKLAGK